MKKIVSAIAMLILFAGVNLQAAPYYGYAQPQTRAPQMDQSGPGQLLREGMTNLLKFMRQPERPNQHQIEAFLQREIAPYFDFNYMAGWVAGPMNRQMNDKQREELAGAIAQMLLGTLTERLVGYQNQDVRFYPPRRAGENEVKVRIGILQASGYPANIDFRFYRSRTGWKIFDVSANGSSALAFYRQYFSRQMAQRQMPRGYQR
jgi:phospholipid transport system substrate-binding protein